MKVTSGIQEGLLSKPSGGAAMRSLGERFQPDLLKGSGNYSVPIKTPKGPNELCPNLTLRYSTGLGNGPYGIGWQLSGPLFILRRSDKGLPAYGPTDEFILGGGEILVPVGGNRYRPRSETQFWQIKHVGEGWSIQTKDGRKYELGMTSQARMESDERVFGWMVETETDPAGNKIQYTYQKQDNQLYLNRLDWSIYHLAFVYEQRPDIIHNGRSGFPVKTRMRGSRIELRCDTESQPLLAHYEMSYEQAPGTQISLLSKVSKSGFDANGTKEDFPALNFTYSKHEPDSSKYMRIEADHIPPPSLGESGNTLVDMDGDGLPDILQAHQNGHRYWKNKGNGRIGEMLEMKYTPLGIDLENPDVSFTDLNGDGSADLFKIGTRLNMAITNTGLGKWATDPVFFKQQFPLLISDANSRFVDLDGDGVPDLLQTSPHGFTLVYNQGEEGWSDPETIIRKTDLNLFPNVSLGSEDIYLADMTGDDLSDIVYLVSGRVSYWPYYGYGKWGGIEEMKNAPVFPKGFSRERLFLTDLDGDGLTDLLYVDFDRIYYWMNQSGQRWSDTFEIPFIPPPQVESVYSVDLLGKGTRGLLWSMAFPKNNDSGYRFLDLSDSIKPYLLTEIEDGFGGVTKMEYKTSTTIRSLDEASGEPWKTYLPFPLQVVDRITEIDKITGLERETHLNYHKGYFDPYEKVFRGFERVTMTRTGDDHNPGVQQVSHFYLGSMTDPGRTGEFSPEDLARDHALSGGLQKVQVFELTPDGKRQLTQSAETEWEAREEFNDGRHFVFFPRPKATHTRYHVEGDTDKLEKAEYEHDTFGNVVGKKLWTRFEGQTDTEADFTDQKITFAINTDSWLVGLPARIEARDRHGNLLTDVHYHYDGPDFDGLPLGQISHGMRKRTIELAMADWAITADYKDGIDDSWGYIQKAEGLYQIVEAYRHDSMGNITAIKGPLGASREFIYDANQLFPAMIATDDGISAQCTFDVRTAQPLQLVSEGGIVTEYQYTPLGRLKAEFNTLSDGSLQLTQYFRTRYFAESPVGVSPPAVYSVKPLQTNQTVDQLESIADLSSLIQHSLEIDYYDCQGNLLQRSKRGAGSSASNEQWILASVRRFTFTGQPRTDYPNTFSDSPDFLHTPNSGGEIHYFYDTSGKGIRVEHPDGGRYRVDYYNNRIEKWDAGMADTADPIIETFTSRGHLTGVQHPVGDGTIAKTQYKVDYAGRILQITDAAGNNSIQYTYGGPGSPIRIEHKDAGTRTFWRDANGHLRAREDSLGRRLEMDYDLHGRMITATDVSDPHDPLVVRRFVYQKKNLLRIDEGNISIKFQNDLIGRPLSKSIDFGDGQPLTMARTYGMHGEVRSMTYPDGSTINLDYHLNGSAKSISSFVDEAIYNAHNNPLEIGFDGAPTLRFQYDDAFKRIISTSLEAGGNQLRHLSWQYDNLGQITRLEDHLSNEVFGRRYSYDGLYRLIKSQTLQGGLSGNLLREDNYSYSMTGDITQNGESDISNYKYENTAHPGQLTSVQLAGSPNPLNLKYDAGGRLTETDEMEALEYDIWDRLIAARLKDGTQLQFEYDHQNRRLRKRVVKNGSTKTSRYFENFYEEQDDGKRLNVYLGRLLVARVEQIANGSMQKAYIITDHLGSILTTCNEQGQVLQEQAYTPFGRALRASGTDSRYIGLFSEDEFGLVQMGARYYHPLLGRFITPDWFVAEHAEKAMRLPQGFNVYSYAINNPIMLRDPTGLWFGIDDLIVAAIGFVVGFFTGLIVGLSQGRGFGESLLLGLEAGLLGAAGAWLAYNTMGLALAGLGALGLGASGGVAAGLMITAAVIGGLNGIISGTLEIYDWSSWTGWAAFLSDSTWGLIGTTIGVLLHTVNLFYGDDRNYRQDLSRRQNRHVYDGGFGFGDFAFTQGNVVSNLNGRTGSLLDHETLHILQSRVFGPIFQITYVAWLIVGFIVALIVAPFTEQGIGQDIMDIAYLNNPWETWAYDVGGTPSGGTLSWT